MTTNKTVLSQGVGRRKEAMAEVFILEKTAGNEKTEFFVRHRDRSSTPSNYYDESFSGENYFNHRSVSIRRALEPAIVTETVRKYLFSCRVEGGGKSAQADAIRLGIAKALLKIEPELKPIIKAGDYGTRDARTKERMKVGKHGARAGKQSPIR